MLDVHCHLDLYQNPLEIAKDAELNKTFTIAITNLPSHFEMGYSHLLKFKRIRIALGMHPLMADRHKEEIPIFLRMLSKTSYIGEIGLDFSREGIQTKNTQIEIFRFILRNISDRPRYISIHSRNAEGVVLDTLKEFKIDRAVFHWYSGSLPNLKRAINSGHYFSINPAMIKSKKGQEIIKNIPQNRVLTETDGPYVQINGRPAKPADVDLVFSYLSKVWLLSIKEVKTNIKNNFNTLIAPIRFYI